MAVTGRTSSFSESRFFELLTAATTPASQAELRRSISGEKYQRILTSGSGASLLPCDATMSRRHTPPRNNPPRNTPPRSTPPRNNACTSAHHLNFTSDVPSIDAILQSLRKLNAEVQIQKQNREASLKRKVSRPSLMESMEEIKKRCEIRVRKIDSSDQYHRSSASMLHHPFRSPSPREPAPIVPDPSLKRMEVGVERLGQLVQSAKNQVETGLSQVRELSGEFLESSSPQLHHHREHVHYHHETPKAYALAPLFKKSEIKSIEIVEPALIVQDPVDEDVNEISGQKLQETAAHQVFEEMPQPSTQTFDDEDEGAKSQETEATSKDFPEATPKSKHPVLENHEVNGINLLNDNAKLELSWCDKKNVQDYTAIDTEELSYEVEVNCKLEIVVVALIAAHFFQVTRPSGADKERIGVG